MKPLNFTEQVPINKEVKQLFSEILNIVKEIKYGYVQLTIHNGEIVQIDKTEKIRLDRQKSKSKGGDAQE